MDEGYAKHWHTHYMARGERYKANHPEMIQLRAFYIDGAIYPRAGIALPDGRMIVGGTETHSSERALLKHYSGARVVWVSEADKAINAIDEGDLP